MWREWIAGLCVVAATGIITAVAIAAWTRLQAWCDARTARIEAEELAAEWRRREAEIEAYRQAAIDAYQNN